MTNHPNRSKRAVIAELVAALEIAERVTKTWLPHNRYPDGTPVPGPSEELRKIQAAIAKGRAAIKPKAEKEG